MKKRKDAINFKMKEKRTEIEQNVRKTKILRKKSKQ